MSDSSMLTELSSEIDDISDENYLSSSSMNKSIRSTRSTRSTRARSNNSTSKVNKKTGKRLLNKKKQSKTEERNSEGI